MNLLQKAQQAFANDLYATELSGIELTSLSTNEATCKMAITPQHMNAVGMVMGGAIFTLADLAFAAAANSESIEQEEKPQWVSVESSIHYLSSSKASELIARAQFIKKGRRNCLIEISVSDPEGRLIAVVQTTGMKITS